MGDSIVIFSPSLQVHTHTRKNNVHCMSMCHDHWVRSSPPPRLFLCCTYVRRYHCCSIEYVRIILAPLISRYDVPFQAPGKRWDRTGQHVVSLATIQGKQMAFMGNDRESKQLLYYDHHHHPSPLSQGENTNHYVPPPTTHSL